MSKVESRENSSSENKNSNEKPSEEKESSPLTNSTSETEAPSSSNSSNHLKSEIMLVHEYAYRLKKNVKFEVCFNIDINY